MYIFGGCTSTNTTFNDLWRFDLMDRKWVRPLAIGNTNYNRNHYYRGTTVSTSQSILIVAFTKFSRILSQCVLCSYFKIQFILYDLCNFLGTYPSPKACASLVAYKDNLVLFGGWSHPTPYPLHQVNQKL